MPNDVLFPVLIGLAAVAVAIVIHLLTRPKPSRLDIDPSPSRRPLRRKARRAPAKDTAAVSPTGKRDLLAWHRDHEGDVLALFDHADRLLVATTETEHEPPELSLESHPEPEVGAELSAMQAAVVGMGDAIARGDDAARTRHSDVYRTYRQRWIERLSQFPVDRSRLEEVRRRRTEVVGSKDNPS